MWHALLCVLTHAPTFMPTEKPSSMTTTSSANRVTSISSICFIIWMRGPMEDDSSNTLTTLQGQGWGQVMQHGQE